ncbi:MAG: hypothetical protein MUP90_12320 [Gammaproteobacteria bacterium]|nr:hypothetical protein [Gammaproteobacteria bacterium]
MNKKTAITIAITLAALLLSACGPGYIKTPTPEPTPIPTPQPIIVGVSAEEIKAIFDGLDTIQVDEIMLALADAGRADTETAHTSDLGQLIEDIAPALPWAALALLFASCTIVALAALATWRAERKRQPLQALDIRLEGIARLLENVAPRNSEGENETD